MASPQWRFDDFHLDPNNACLWRGTQPVALTPKAFDVLHYLVTHPDRLITKDTLLDAVWAETAVSEAVVRIAIGELRRALGDTAQASRYIATVPRRGYRFLAPVEAYTSVAPVPVPVSAGPGPVAASQLPETLPPPEAERRHLTVLFCNLVDATTLAGHLDPEDLREVVRAYHHTCAAVIHQYDGYIAQYLGDGLLVYFGYPQAHEDDAPRAVRTGLGLVEAVATLNRRLAQRPGGRLAVRVGIHTGLVVVGPMGSGERQQQLALGETPNLAARLQGLAAPDTVVISAATQRLVQGYFTCHALGGQTLRGVTTALQVHQVVGATAIQQRFDIAAAHGLTPLVGREHEVGLLRERWAQVQAGRGHIVVLRGEAGIGKSRLVQVVKDEIIGAATLRIEYRCLPSHQHSALSPIIAHLERVLAFHRDDTPADRLRKLEEALRPSPLPLAEVVPLVAALLSLPLPEERYPPLTLTPQRQKQKTLEALLTWLLALTEAQPVLFIVEDLHWIDPSTLEFLTLLVDQGPTARLLTLLTCRPEFAPPWGLRTHLTPMALQRLPQAQVEAMIARVTGGRALPPEVVAQIVAKTDGVPLFVEELTKMVLESGLLRETAASYELTGSLPPLAIPATLHDSLMARLDRLATVKAVAQLGAVLGRTFAYELLQAVMPLDEAPLQQALARLVDAELLYQHGVPPQATYLFKHALIQDAAYQSLLKSTRQQVHQRIAEVLATQFPASVETQPELVAQHYTAAGCPEPAVVYWQRAGELASARSAHLEAISHYTTGIALLRTLPETPARLQHAVLLHSALGAALQMTKGQAAPEVEHAYTQAHALCQQLGETPQLVPVLVGLWRFCIVRPQLHRAREISETLLRLAQQAPNPVLAVIAHYALGVTWFWLGALPAARVHLEEGIARYRPDQRRALVFRTGQDPGVACRLFAAATLWLLGYPVQALARVHEALALAHALSQPYSLAFARCVAAMVAQFRRDVPAMHEQAEAAVALSTEQGFPLWGALGASLQGWALALQGQGEAGMAQIGQGIATGRSTGAAVAIPYLCTLLADVAAHLGHIEDGLQALAEAHTLVEQHEERWWEAEVCRLRGVLVLRQPGTPQAEAETWLQRALDVARRQEAKSLELRAAMSLARLWQQQGKRAAAYELLAPIYGWFTEGFDTADLQEAKALLEEFTEGQA
jgi:class 3 adenylate cyclase/DNA-binding winged helix-turn-helix (wHTH) protein/predicted ATPase